VPSSLFQYDLYTVVLLLQVGENASHEDVNLNDMFIEIEHLREECVALKKKVGRYIVVFGM
jgi:hypothetical protein